jgi:TonB family protein
MLIAMVGVYLKLNLLLAAAYLLWLITKHGANALGKKLNPKQQLVTARYVFSCVWVFALVMLLINTVLSAFFSNAASSLPGLRFVDELTVLPFNQQLGWWSSLSLSEVLLAVFISVVVIKLILVCRQLRQLQALISNATEWKCLNQVHVLLSPEIASPFSTKALGIKHIVLPLRMIDTPRNFRLALAHELQHLRNGDLDWVLLLEACKLLCCWNPAMYCWYHELDALQEYACDEALIQERHVDTQAYGNCLLEVASVHAGVSLVGALHMVPNVVLFKTKQSYLKRRITMLMTVSNTKNANATSLAYRLITGSALLGISVLVFAAENAQQKRDAVNPNADVVPLVRVPPQYPASALQGKLIGWVILEFTIDENGAVVDPKAIKGCAGIGFEECEPSETFYDVALEAISKWKYKPSIESGVAVKRSGVQTMLRFSFADPNKK